MMRQLVWFMVTAICFMISDIDATVQEYECLPEEIWHLRITNPVDAATELCVRIHFNGNNPPWHGKTIFLGKGNEQKKLLPQDKWLGPGQSSQWIDIGKYMSIKPSFGGSPNYLSPIFLGTMRKPETNDMRLVVELSRGRKKHLVRRIDVSETKPPLIGYSTWLACPPKIPTLGLLIPVDPVVSERIYTLEEAAEQQLKWIDSYGPVPKQPQYIWFISHQSQVAFKNPSRLSKMQTEIVRRLGYNNLTYYANDYKDIEAIRAMGVEPLPAKIVFRDNAEQTAQKMKKAGTWEYVRLANFGDEISIDLRSTADEQDAAFVKYLRGKGGFNPLDFVRPKDEPEAATKPSEQQWQYVHLACPLPTQKPKLFYEAAVFQYRLWSREMAESTRQIEACFPPGTLTGSNYSPHRNAWPDVRKWVNMFRDGGMTMPWSEDWWWQIPEASPQAFGYLLDTLRHASDYHNSPFCFYTIPDPIPEISPEQRADDFLRMNYFALGHQAKVIDHFAIYHQAFGTCDYIDFELSKYQYRSIHRILGDVSQIDERLYKARMRPSEVAIVMPVANDVWNTEDMLANPEPTWKTKNLYYAKLNVDNHERKALWMALRHSQLPVDLITDGDICDGMLTKYKVIYLVGQELLSQAAPKIEQWVKAGGILVGSGGGGLLNQYREPLELMYRLYGIEDAVLQRPVRNIGPARDLPKMSPLDSMTFNSLPGGKSITIPALCYKHELKAGKQASIIATYSDGTAAAVQHSVGNGTVVLLGGLAGLAYLQPAMSERQRLLPETFPTNVRMLISSWAESANVSRDVVTSDYLVDATLQEGALGAVVTLSNFRNQPLQKVTVSIPGLPNAGEITSLRHGKLSVYRTKDGPTVTVPIDQGDFLIID